VVYSLKIFAAVGSVGTQWLNSTGIAGAITQSPTASRAGNVSKPRLMPQVAGVRKVVCA
jgi:hypothetical protein